ncbi:hypothetical protein MHF_0985 [Mycoplasma haemofelis Ohio2]|uniref:Uncharacterized protein n=1 Tax=Mycoplasma haemofelis (strain Ohio2) TaxID=859194 RepID=F6FJ42_MYCHI|nr:hypothetical protein MHF_0985 [Mycoplasma haemofelis Ohio2]
MSKLAMASVAGVGSVAGVSGGAYLLTRNSSNALEIEKSKTLRTRLESENYTPLDVDNVSHKTHWDTSLTKYKAQYTSKNTWNDSQLKERCSELFNKEIISNEDYTEARKYCVVPRDISGRLSDAGFHPLSTEESTKWTKLSKEYKKGGDGFKKLGDLEHDKASEPSSSALREKCKEVLKKDHWDANYDSLLESSTVWCTEEGFSKLPTGNA